MPNQERNDVGTDEGTYTRRHYLGATVAAATAAAAGCSGILGGGGGAGDPAGATRSFYDALTSGNAEEANSYVHPDSDVGQITEEQAQQFSELEFGLESVEVLEQGEDRADVSVTLNVMGESQTTQLELRTHEGEWKLYSGGV